MELFEAIEKVQILLPVVVPVKILVQPKKLPFNTRVSFNCFRKI